ncbi:MAG: hypothetical protein R3E78_05000 [Burkholderiaceae bacterium]
MKGLPTLSALVLAAAASRRRLRRPHRSSSATCARGQPGRRGRARLRRRRRRKVDAEDRRLPANALGDYTVGVQERVSVGAIDMALQPAATAADRRMQLGVFPYLANDWAGARRVFGKWPGCATRSKACTLSRAASLCWPRTCSISAASR